MGDASARLPAHFSARLVVLRVDRVVACCGEHWSRTAVAELSCRRPAPDTRPGRLALVRQDDRMGPAESARNGNLRLDVLLGAALALGLDHQRCAPADAECVNR